MMFWKKENVVVRKGSWPHLCFFLKDHLFWHRKNWHLQTKQMSWMKTFAAFEVLVTSQMTKLKKHLQLELPEDICLSMAWLFQPIQSKSGCFGQLRFPTWLSAAQSCFFLSDIVFPPVCLIFAFAVIRLTVRVAWWADQKHDKKGDGAVLRCSFKGHHQRGEKNESHQETNVLSALSIDKNIMCCCLPADCTKDEAKQERQLSGAMRLTIWYDHSLQQESHCHWHMKPEHETVLTWFDLNCDRQQESICSPCVMRGSRQW